MALNRPYGLGLLRPTNQKARILVGLLLAGLFCIQCTQPTEAIKESKLVTVVSGQVVGKTAPDMQRKIESLAKKDHIELLEFCLEQYRQRFSDYTCTFVKQERINGVTGKEQVVHVKFMEHPFSVAMAWTPQTALTGDRVVYVDGMYGGQMLVRPANPMFNNLVGTQRRWPDSPEVLKATLRPVNKFGFEQGLISLIDVYKQAKAAGELKESFGGYADVDGRKTIVLIRHLPPKDAYPAERTETYIDLEYLVPIFIKGYDWGNPQELCCSYMYRDVKFNVGLTADDFLPQANDMKPPK
jgi:hypothetical protein